MMSRTVVVRSYWCGKRQPSYHITGKHQGLL